MKKFFLITLVVIGLEVQAQITLEHTYDSASTVSNIGPNGAEQSQLLLVKFEVSGERYVRINRWAKNISLYNLNHVLLKTIAFSNFPMDFYNKSGFFIYFSENLFDLDNGMEFMYGLQLANGAYLTRIYNEDGSVLFSDTCAALIIPNFHQQQYPIYNTAQGAKMILSYHNMQAKVFSL